MVLSRSRERIFLLNKGLRDDGIWSHHFMEIDGETVETVSDFIFWGAPKSLQMVIVAMKLKDACSLEGKL